MQACTHTPHTCPHYLFYLLLSLIPISSTFQITKKLHRPFDALIKAHNRLVTHVTLRSVAQVKVVRTCQRHFHRRQGWVERGEGTEEFADDHEEKSDEVDEEVREVNVWSIVAKSLDYARHEGPEVDGLVVGDVVGLGNQRM